MKNYSILASASVTLLALLILGCAQRPDQEMKTAKALLDSALSVQADKYAAEDFKIAKDSLDGAIAEIEKKNYTKAKVMLVAASTAAYNAKMKAAEEKKQATFEADTALTNVNTLLTEVNRLIEKAPKGKSGMKAIKKEIAAVEISIGEAQKANGNDEYIIARDKANACIAKLDSLKNVVTAAKAKTLVKGKKKKK